MVAAAAAAAAVVVVGGGGWVDRWVVGGWMGGEKVDVGT